MVSVTASQSAQNRVRQELTRRAAHQGTLLGVCRQSCIVQALQVAVRTIQQIENRRSQHCPGTVRHEFD
jgi:hypothetical protein